MAQRVEAFAAEASNLSSIPQAHMVEERAGPCRLSSGLHMHTVACT